MWNLNPTPHSALTLLRFGATMRLKFPVAFCPTLRFCTLLRAALLLRFLAPLLRSPLLKNLASAPFKGNHC